MRVLALADKRPLVEPARLAADMRVDAVVCLGDLDLAWIESLNHVGVPRIGVHGNHDAPGQLREAGVEDLHLKVTRLRGFSVAGFEGCVRYKRDGNHMYDQREAAKLVRRLPPADVLICHCPPYGINDDPEDPAHTGFVALREWVDQHRPRHVLHGHTHLLPMQVQRTHGDTRVHYVSGARVIELR